MSARILPAFDQIIAGTRQHLESIPDGQLDWKPHDKSYTIGELGSHLANLPGWVMATLGQDELDVAPPDGGDGAQQPDYGSSAAMVAALDENAAAAHAMIEAASDEDLMADWTLLKGGEALFTLPKIAVLRTFVMDHMIHHRGQLTVYLRLLDVPVKQTFGPTADFPDM
jgi:uncharacterized damage-inducible protein DinB